jgi:hypothetical protein
MGRTFHNLHVYASNQRMRDRVGRIVLAYAKQHGYERTTSTKLADRVIRIGGRAPWLTIEDDGYEVEAIGKAIAAHLRTPILEAYCEASARVGLGLRLGRTIGGWGWGYDKRPAVRAVEAILDEGTAADFEQAWLEGARQVFPETALAVAAKRFGIDAATMFRDKQLRGTTLALRRRRPKWTPAYRTGKPAFDVGWGSNQGWGYKHLVFEEELEQHRVQVTSTGGAGKGFAIRFAGTALSKGHIEIVDVQHDTMKLVRDGDVWRDASATVPAGLVDRPDVFALSRSENEKARAITDEVEYYVDVHYRGVKQGECKLDAIVECEGVRSKGTLDMMVMWRPWRPSLAHAHVGDSALFALHRCDQTSLHVALRGTLADAWAWARPHLERWTAAHDEHFLQVQRGNDIILRERTGYLRDDDTPEPPLPWDRVAEHFPATRTTTLQACGEQFRFGTFAYASWGMDPREQLVVQLVLFAQNPDDDPTGNVALLAAIANDAIARGVAYSAHLGVQQYGNDERTTWEEITVTDDAPLKLVAWHEAHIRGLNKRIWMSADHAARIDRAALAAVPGVEITDLGRGIRVLFDIEAPRRDLEALIPILGPLLPSHATIEQFKTERAAQLAVSAAAAMPAERVVDERP